MPFLPNMKIDGDLHNKFKVVAAIKKKSQTKLILDFIKRMVRRHYPYR